MIHPTSNGHPQGREAYSGATTERGSGAVIISRSFRDFSLRLPSSIYLSLDTHIPRSAISIAILASAQTQPRHILHLIILTLLSLFHFFTIPQATAAAFVESSDLRWMFVWEDLLLRLVGSIVCHPCFLCTWRSFAKHVHMLRNSNASSCTFISYRNINSINICQLRLRACWISRNAMISHNKLTHIEINVSHTTTNHISIF